MNQQSKRAIVMGGSVAGLWTARALADHFDEVLLLERDTLPDGPEMRSGVPQARQYHVMLLRGLQIMDQLFPGLREELIAEGAIHFDVVNDTALRSRNQWLPQFPSDQTLLSCSRLLLEAGLRRRLRVFGNVRFVENVEATGLETDAQATRITGVHIKNLRDGQQSAGSTETLSADFVVDALGRRSPTPEWLTGLGYDAPEVSVVDSFLGYVTRRYRQPENYQASWRMMLIGATPPNDPRGGLIFPEENGVWTVMLAGVNKDYPPTDDAGFYEFAHSLGPEFYSAIQATEPISKAYGYRGTDSTRRHYEKLTHWPDRYVVLGDAFCGFNSIYGQGMTVSALSLLWLWARKSRRPVAIWTGWVSAVWQNSAPSPTGPGCWPPAQIWSGREPRANARALGWLTVSPVGISANWWALPPATAPCAWLLWMLPNWSSPLPASLRRGWCCGSFAMYGPPNAKPMARRWQTVLSTRPSAPDPIPLTQFSRSIRLSAVCWFRYPVIHPSSTPVEQCSVSKPSELGASKPLLNRRLLSHGIVCSMPHDF
jgi:2-polyprenyl-6-methoxyphenol hydroxylase-like FAD-dependent oxidoreductase